MDERLQGLRRAWLEGGGVEAEREFLLASLRAGSISWLRVETAAYLGDAAASGLLGEDALALVAPASGLNEWGEQLPCRYAPGLNRLHLLEALRCFVEDPPADVGELSPTERALEELAGVDLARVEQPEEVVAKLRLLQAVFESTLATPPDDALARDVLKAGHSLVRSLVEPRWEPVNFLARWFDAHKKRALAARERATAAFLPRILSEPCPDPAGEDAVQLGNSYGGRDRAQLADARAERLEDGENQLVQLGAIDPELARAVLAEVELPAKKLKAAEGAALFRAYLLAKGWAEKRGQAFLAPGGAKRVKLKKSSLGLEQRRHGVWDKKPTWAGRKVGTARAGEQLREALERAAQA